MDSLQVNCASIGASQLTQHPISPIPLPASALAALPTDSLPSPFDPIRNLNLAGVPMMPAAVEPIEPLNIQGENAPTPVALTTSAATPRSQERTGIPTLAAEIPTAEEVARALLQQLVFRHPPAQTVAAIQTPVPELAPVAASLTDSQSMPPHPPELQTQTAAANAGPIGGTSGPVVSGSMPSPRNMSIPGTPSHHGSPSMHGLHLRGVATSFEKSSAEELLDQQNLSSQKVSTYRVLPSHEEGTAISNTYLNRLFGLHGQVAIVTGAARGIGLAIAQGLAMAGARVCMADMNVDQVARESALLNEELKQNDATFPLLVDVTKRESIVNMFTKTVDHYGLLSICVNNAGLAISGEDPKRNYSESFSEEDFDRTMDLNLKAVFFCCQFAARWMIANSVKGSIINVGSMSAQVVNWPQRQSVYNASKAAVVQLTKCLAVEWCSYGIRVNSISPGYIDTPLNRQLSIAHLRHEWTKKTPQHRLGDPRDLVAATLYLASNRASAFTTGENMVIDGGYTLW